MRLLGRTVTADVRLPLPAAGEALYVFTHRALTRTERSELESTGLTYLGVVDRHVYAFVRAGGDPAVLHRNVGPGLRSAPANRARQTTTLARAPFVTGTAVVTPSDRLEPELLKLSRDDRHPSLPVSVTFWPSTPAREAALLAGRALDAVRWPTGPEAVMGERRFIVLEANAAQIRTLAESPWVASMELSHPRVVFNADSRLLSRANGLAAAPYNLDGSGVVVGHWDGGPVDAAHPDFGGRVDNQDNGPPDTHATHTAGTVLGNGSGNAQARGYAPAATMVAYDFSGNVGEERRAAKHEFFHQVDNHSWGSISTNYGGYDGLAQEFDVDARDLLMLAVKAAGNSGQQSRVIVENNAGIRYGFDSLPPDSTGKNVLVVGATADNGNLTGFSSRGPTQDARIKPDICANGDSLTSPVPGARYAALSGTSMAAPSITGMATLLAQLHQERIGIPWAPDTARAIFIHTAVDVFNPGPDYRHGWGNADAQAAADLIVAEAENPGQVLVRGAVREGETAEYPLEVPAGASELKVTLTWLDAFSNSTVARRLIHNLDLELVAPNQAIEYPYTLDGANPLNGAVRTGPNVADNVEQVRVAQPAAGTWTVRVRGTSVSDLDLPVQGFVLASTFPLSRAVQRLDATVPTAGSPIPDNDAAGLPLRFTLQNTGPISSLRVRLDIRHPSRGQLRVTLAHPNGTTVTLEAEDASTRRDIFAVYPDLRSYDDDVTVFYQRPGNGTWTLTVIDTAAGQAGMVLRARMEFDLVTPIGPPPNTAPLADAGRDTEVQPGAQVTLDGSLSRDPDADPLTFQWTQTQGPTVTVAESATSRARFVAPNVLDRTDLVFRLTVRDPSAAVGMDDVRIVVVPGVATPNRSPVANAGFDRRVKRSAPIMLDGSGSADPDRDTLTFQWQQLEGSTVVLSDPASPTPQFTAPSIDSILRFRLRVTDPRGEVDVDDVTITVGDAVPPAPVPNPNPTPEAPSPGPSAKPDATPSTLDSDAIMGGCRHVTFVETRITPSALGWFGALAVLWARRRRRLP